MSNLTLFFVFFAVSMIPWAIAWFVDIDIAKGLMIIDCSLTIAAFVFLTFAIGWWVLLAILAMSGVGQIMLATGCSPYIWQKRG